MRNILTSRNYRFLDTSDPSPLEEIVVDMRDDQGELAPPSEGEIERDGREGKWRGELESDKTIPSKHAAEQDIDTREPRKTRGV